MPGAAFGLPLHIEVVFQNVNVNEKVSQALMNF